MTVRLALIGTETSPLITLVLADALDALLRPGRAWCSRRNTCSLRPPLARDVARQRGMTIAPEARTLLRRTLRPDRPGGA